MSPPEGIRQSPSVDLAGQNARRQEEEQLLSGHVYRRMLKEIADQRHIAQERNLIDARRLV
jgi:hypothetical protein